MIQDTLIAIVSSLLPSNQPMHSQAEIMDALVTSNGDATAAAQSLQAESSKSFTAQTTLKRKRVDLNGWLNPRSFKQEPSARKPESSRKHESSTSRLATPPRNPDRQLPSSSASTSKPILNLMDVLRQPDSPRKTAQRYTISDSIKSRDGSKNIHRVHCIFLYFLQNWHANFSTG